MRVNLDRTDEPLCGISDADPLPPEDGLANRSGRAPLDELYRSQKARLLRFFARRTSADEAHDLVQETFTRYASARRPISSDIKRPEAYISRIAGNLLRDRAKLAGRRSSDLHVGIEEVVLAGPDQQNALEARDMLNRLQVAMLQLKPMTREIFMAHRLDGYGYAEIAARTGLSIKGVEKHMSRAIAHIDRMLGPR